MQISFAGVASIVTVFFSSALLNFTVFIWFDLLLGGVKYGFGDEAARPVYLLFNKVQNYLETLWFTFVSSLLELLQGTKISYTIVDGAGQKHQEQSSSCATDEGGRKRPFLWHLLTPPSGPGKVKFIMLNHHCRVDWIYLFLYFARSSMTPTLRIVLKEDLKAVPLMGCSMENFRFLFLSRSWTQDEKYLREMTAYFQRTGEAVTILIFPEGTDLSPSNVARSQEFARKNGLPVMHHVLNPRTTGLVALKNMFGAENVEEIVDCTMGYTYGQENTRPAEVALVNGKGPRRVHLLLRRYRLDSTTSPNPDDLKDVAPGNDDEALKRWINERFKEKEQLLSRFYNNSPVGFDAHDIRAVMGEECGVLGYDGGQERTATGALKNALTIYCNEIGLARVVINAVMWFLFPIYVMTHFNGFLLLGYLLICLFAQRAIMRRVGGAQRALLLNQVPKEQSIFFKLRTRATTTTKHQ